MKFDVLTIEPAPIVKGVAVPDLKVVFNSIAEGFAVEFDTIAVELMEAHWKCDEKQSRKAVVPDVETGFPINVFMILKFIPEKAFAVVLRPALFNVHDLNVKSPFVQEKMAIPVSFKFIRHSKKFILDKELDPVLDRPVLSPQSKTHPTISTSVALAPVTSRIKSPFVSN